MAVTRYLKIDSKTGRRKEESERELGKKLRRIWKESMLMDVSMKLQ